MEYLGILVLVGLFVILLLLGVPIAVCIGIATIGTMLVTIDFLPALTTVSQRMGTALDSFALLAIPLFILSGHFMSRGGIAHRLIELAKVFVGRFSGGLAYVNILACLLFGAIAGSAVAAAAAIGAFMIPLMIREGYDRSYGASVNVTSATSGLIIPPSNILIVYSLASGGVSIAALFLAGYVPGLLMGISLMFVSGILARKNRYPVGEKVSLTDGIKKLFDALPSLLLIVIVVGGIIAGYFTATEASAIAVLYTFILSVVIYREIKFKEVPQVFLQSVVTTGVVTFLIATSMAMSWIMSYENIPQNITAALLSLTESKLVILLIINVVLLGVGTFMDMTPAVLIFTPIFLPVAIELGLDPVHFGIIMIMNLCIGLCTPPVGTVLFVGCGIAETSITKMIKPLIPLLMAMIFTLLVVTFVPELSLFLPRVFGF
jgi:tripartite ATP-independent transporter DctM subunit